MFLLAESERERALAEWRWGIMLILFIGIVTLLVMLFAFGMRRWKRRQLALIEQEKAERKQARSAGRVDAWQASSERYVDHDKLVDDHGRSADGDALDETDGEAGSGFNDPEEVKDPYGLFDGMPYQEPEDEDDEDEEQDDWDEDEEEDPEDKP